MINQFWGICIRVRQDAKDATRMVVSPRGKRVDENSRAFLIQAVSYGPLIFLFWGV